MSKKAYNWIWKWHFIGGLISFPVIFVLAITGIIYLFKDQYESPLHEDIKHVNVGTVRVSYQNQWELARQYSKSKINSMVLPNADHQATAFVSGRFGSKSSVYINPYTGTETGHIKVSKTTMYKVRKLHGELLAGRIGTKVVELIGSWMIILILSGLFLFFPRRRKDLIKLFRIRIKGGQSLLYRDIHMVGGFWFSIMLLLILAGGMPWTDVFGDGFKWVQQQTHTGYPMTWQGKGINSTVRGEPATLDEIVKKVKAMNLPGEVTISLPEEEAGIFSVHNSYFKDQSQQIAIHIDRYSGETLMQLDWQDVGVLMRGRMWAMAFHQGQFGWWNWILVLFTALGLLVLSISAIISFLLRKSKSNWGIPANAHVGIGYGYYAFILLMGIILPMFGISIIVIWVGEKLNQLRLAKSRHRDMVSS